MVRDLTPFLLLFLFFFFFLHQVLMVLGHSSCGAVAATIAGGPVPGVISSLYYG